MFCGTSRTMQQINHTLTDPRNRHEAVVVDEEGLLAHWLELQVTQGKLSRAEADDIWNRVRHGTFPGDPEQGRHLEKLMEAVLGSASSGVDAVKAQRVMRDFRGMGQYREQIHHGKRYIIFKGNPRVRSVFRGTRYLATNPLIVSMGIGHLGAANTVKAGGILTLVLLVPFRVGQAILSDERTMTWLVGTLAADVIKVVAVAGLMVMGALVIGVIFKGVVAASLLGAVFVGIISSRIVDSVDKQLGLTDKLITGIAAVLENSSVAADTLRALPCRAQHHAIATAKNIIDSTAQALVEHAERTGRAAVGRIVRKHVYPGWHFRTGY